MLHSNMASCLLLAWVCARPSVHGTGQQGRQCADLKEQGGQEGEQRRVGFIAKAARVGRSRRGHQQRLQAAHAAVLHLQPAFEHLKCDERGLQRAPRSHRQVPLGTARRCAAPALGAWASGLEGARSAAAP